MRFPSLVAGVVLGSLLTVSAGAAAMVVPKAVQRAVDQIFGGAETKIEHEKEGGADKYEVAGPATLEVVFDANGVVAEIEVKIPIGLVPPAVLGAAKGALPRAARIEAAELLIRGAKVLYEVEARSGTDEIEMLLDAGGAVIEQHVEKDDAAGDD